MSQEKSANLGVVSDVAFVNRIGKPPALAAVCKRTYTIRSGRLQLADEQLPLVHEPEFDVDDAGELGELLDDTDLLGPKELTDVVIRGTVYAPARTRTLLVGAAVGTDSRVLTVWGQRRAEVDAEGRVAFSAAEPFDEVPISFREAYGGYDAQGQDLLEPPAEGDESATYTHYAENEDGTTDVQPLKLRGTFDYPRNSVGRAYFIDVERRRADGALLPRLEDPNDALTPDRFFVRSPAAWIDAPMAASLGWVQYSWFPRLARFVGRLVEHDDPTRAVREVDLPGGDDLGAVVKGPPRRRLTGEFTPLPRALQGASPGLAVRRLKGNEPVELRHLHRREQTLRFELPGEVPFVTLRPPGLASLTPKPVLQTVRIDPDEDRVSLTWCAPVPLLAEPDDEFLQATALEVAFRRL